MAAGQGTSTHYYLSTSRFPVVVLTECAPLSDSERAMVCEELARLLEQREPHVLVVDLMQGAALPDAQRRYFADLTRMHGELVKTKWAGLAVVVGDPTPNNTTKAAGWQKALPASVPTDCFATLEGATHWAEDQLAGMGASGRGSVVGTRRATHAPATPPGGQERSDRPSGARKPARGAEPRTSISEYLSIPPDNSQKRQSKKPKPFTLKTWLMGRRGAAMGFAVLLSIVLWVLGPPADGRLSSAEASAFRDAKGKLALRLRRQRDGRAEPIANGGTYTPGEKLGFELDVPARGYALVLGRRADGSVQGIGPSTGATTAPLINAGQGLIIPGQYALDAAGGQVSLYLVGCPRAFSPGDCTGTAAGLDCPDDCGVATLMLTPKP